MGPITPILMVWAPQAEKLMLTTKQRASKTLNKRLRLFMISPFHFKIDCLLAIHREMRQVLKTSRTGEASLSSHLNFPHANENRSAEIWFNRLLIICVIRKNGVPDRVFFSDGGREISFEDVRALGILPDLQNRSPQMTKGR